jgi:Fe-S cluster assembly protein SufD
MDPRDHYRSVFESLNGGTPSWLRQRRQQGLTRFLDEGFPTPKLEDWKYTNVAALARQPFRPAPAPALTPAVRAAIDQARTGTGHALVFVDGHYIAELSSGVSGADGLTVVNLRAAAQADADRVADHLGRYAADASHGFSALNQAFMNDGALVWVGRQREIAEPIYLLFVATDAGEQLICPRVLVVVEEGSRAVVVERYVGLGALPSLTSAVTEVVLSRDAAVDHFSVQQQGEAAFHIGTVTASQQGTSRFSSLSIALGGALVRADISTALAAPGSECQLDGLYMARDAQHVDHHTTIDHQQPHCSSRELYKGVLDGRSTGVFNGKVFVRPNAQQSDARQMNKNLLLSENAVINTKPQLEIFADDVKCTHGATIGRLDEDALFYLQSRGIEPAHARDVLVYAFAHELIAHVPVAPIREQLARAVRARLGRSLTDEVSA